MAWQTIDGRRYYYRFRKVKGKRIRTFLGNGPLAELAAREDAERWQRRVDHWAAMRREREELRTNEAPLTLACSGSDDLLRASLLTAGYYQHDHGEWRKRS